jgi:hypothetical protein
MILPRHRHLPFGDIQRRNVLSPDLNLSYSSTMQVAEILSDLTSLRVCVRSTFQRHQLHRYTSELIQDYNDALALVTVNERLNEARVSPDDKSKVAASKRQQEQQNDDLQRAKELVDLHYEMKTKYALGTVDEELTRAREEVNRVLRELEG